MTDELAEWVSSRAAAREMLDAELFAESAETDLISILHSDVRNVARAVAGEARPGNLDSWPVLAACLDMLGTQWQATRRELASRLESDLPELAGRFNGGSSLGRVAGIRGETGDRHRHGRQVLTLQFESGCNIVYKPRDVGPDKSLGELLHWLTAAGSLPAFHAPAVICHLDYGWTEFIEARHAATASEEQALWQRTGGLLALLDLLNARDCHWQNVIVAADQPVLVDAEGLFHRALLVEAPPDSEPESSSALSVLATGLTPYWKRAGDARDESSGAGSPPPERISYVLDGFSSAYRTLLARQSEFLDPEGPLSRFESVRVRTIFRDTAYYQRLMLDACARESLQSVEQRNAALGRLVREHDDPRLAEVERAELAALRRLDVPRFTARVGDRAVDLDGLSIPDWFEATGLDVVRKRIRLQSESELARKLDHLRAVYALAALEASFRRRVSSTT